MGLGQPGGSSTIMQAASEVTPSAVVKDYASPMLGEQGRVHEASTMLVLACN
jgi:hypothetical protein